MRARRTGCRCAPEVDGDGVDAGLRRDLRGGWRDGAEDGGRCAVAGLGFEENWSAADVRDEIGLS
jgi:hypothetical protein